MQESTLPSRLKSHTISMLTCGGFYHFTLYGVSTSYVHHEATHVHGLTYSQISWVSYSIMLCMPKLGCAWLALGIIQFVLIFYVSRDFGYT